MDIELRGSLMSLPVKIRPVVSNGSALTYISKRLASKLGLLMDARDVFVEDTLLSSLREPARRMSVSLCPVVISYTFSQPASIACFPIIIPNDEDCSAEIVIGQDVWQHDRQLLITYMTSSTPNPTRGPAYLSSQRSSSSSSSPSFSGCLRLTDMTKFPRVNEFWEFNRLQSAVVSRLAVNRVTHEIVLLLRDNPVPQCYTQVNSELERMSEDIHLVEELIRRLRHCPCVPLREFPKAVLVGFL